MHYPKKSTVTTLFHGLFCLFVPSFSQSEILFQPGTLKQDGRWVDCDCTSIHCESLRGEREGRRKRGEERVCYMSEF